MGVNIKEVFCLVNDRRAVEGGVLAVGRETGGVMGGVVAGGRVAVTGCGGGLLGGKV